MKEISIEDFLILVKQKHLGKKVRLTVSSYIFLLSMRREETDKLKKCSSAVIHKVCQLLQGSIQKKRNFFFSTQKLQHGASNRKRQTI